MIITPTYKFKKRQLTDEPNIENGEENWDIVEEKLTEIQQSKPTVSETQPQQNCDIWFKVME